jgi:hypothetical protein
MSSDSIHACGCQILKEQQALLLEAPARQGLSSESRSDETCSEACTASDDAPPSLAPGFASCPPVHAHEGGSPNPVLAPFGSQIPFSAEDMRPQPGTTLLEAGARAGQRACDKGLPSRDGMTKAVQYRTRPCDPVGLADPVDCQNRTGQYRQGNPTARRAAVRQEEQWDVVNDGGYNYGGKGARRLTQRRTAAAPDVAVYDPRNRSKDAKEASPIFDVDDTKPSRGSSR